MRKEIYFLFFGFLFSISSIGQKRIIDTSVIRTWYFVLPTPEISGDGKYVMYSVNNFPTGSFTVYVKSVSSEWKHSWERAENAKFSSDSRWIIFKGKGDSLMMFNLLTEKVQFLGKAGSFKLLTSKDREWILFYPKDSNEFSGAVLYDLKTSLSERLPMVSDVVFYPRQKVLLELLTDSVNIGEITAIKIKSLVNNISKIVWRGKKVSSFIDDSDNGGFAFVNWKGNKDSDDPVLSCYRLGADTSNTLIDLHTPGFESELILDADRANPPIFSKDGSKVYFGVKEKKFALNQGAVIEGVNVWHYKENRLHEAELMDDPTKSYYCVVDVVGKRMVRLENEGERIAPRLNYVANNKYSIKRKGGGGDFWWNEGARPSISLVSNDDASEIILKKNVEFSVTLLNSQFYISPNENSILYFDPVEDSYFSYIIDSKRFINLTKGVQTHWKKNYNKNTTADPLYSEPEGVGAWIDKEEAVLVYDEYDIWELDTKGVRVPRNITNGYGRSNGIKFSIVENNYMKRQRVIGREEELLLAAFNSKTKESGFYILNPKKDKVPRRLYMGLCKFGIPQKAKDEKAWMVLKETATQSPNFYYTKDFVQYKKISDVYPESECNWMTASLETWNTIDGETCQGVLYKPMDFDSTRKYPVIFNYYEERSDGMNKFKQPDITRGNVNIPFFVSNGYVVFEPDILYRNDQIPGRSALNAVVSAAEKISNYKWIDSSRMGIQGHSFGGGETNYIITHTNRFAAAAEAAGVCDVISNYNFMDMGISQQSYYELSQGRIRGTMWDKKDMYIDASPVLDADKIFTPLLIMHNKLDGNVPWSQGLGLFMAMRRLSKKVWMLQYDQEGHVLSTRSGLDYTIRLKQFFDYYLKDSNPPKWMVEGIPAKLKGIDNGYKLMSRDYKP